MPAVVGGTLHAQRQHSCAPGLTLSCTNLVGVGMLLMHKSKGFCYGLSSDTSLRALMHQLYVCRIVRPAPVPLTMQAVSEQGAYLMDSGRVFVMWLGRNISPDFMAQVCMFCHVVTIRGSSLNIYTSQAYR